MELSSLLAAVAHAIAIGLCGAFVIASARWIHRRSSALGYIVAAAIALRLVTGLGLFLISFLHLPFAPALQIDGGFWALAPDAQGYYELAAQTVQTHRFAADFSLPSPFFIQALAAWMLAVGVSPLAGAFLNLFLYVLVVRLLVWYFEPVDDVRRDLPCIVGVAALSFSPVILIHATQPLKDTLSSSLVVVSCLGVYHLTRLIKSAPGDHPARNVVLGTVLIAASTFGIARIRWYYAAITWGALATMLAIFTIRGRTTPLSRYVPVCTFVLVVVWLVFRAGAGPFYEMVGASLARAPSQLSSVTQLARTGFLMSGGGTNIVVPLREDTETGKRHEDELLAAQRLSPIYLERKEQLEREERAKGPVSASAGPAHPTVTNRQLTAAQVAAQSEATRAIPVSLADHVKIIASGLALVFLPLSLVRPIFDVAIPGGQGLLSIADLDTVFQDAALASVLALLWIRRRSIGDRLPFVVFGLALAMICALLLGYVVTNFGTLWRLRPLVAIPVWVLVVALSPGADGSVDANRSQA